MRFTPAKPSSGDPAAASGRLDGARGEPMVAARRLRAGRYRVERLLGSGGMGTVWRGRDLRLDRPVAIKVLSGAGLSLPRAMERFDREARAVGRLSHPNIVPVYDVGTDGGDPYLIMELVDGPTVEELLADGPLPIADVLALSAQICDGLAAAHAAKIVHRDIKPSNLILTGTGVVKICDFGVARLLDSAGHANLTGSAIAMGSPKYMAPEQINGDPVDARTDLYGLGCTMYAMLTGHPPFSTGTAYTIVHQHATRTPEPLPARRPEVPADLAALVADLLAKAPDERPPDATAVRARIAAAAGPTAQAAPAAADHRPAAGNPPWNRGRQASSARRWRWAVAAVVAALGLTALVASWPLAVGSGPERLGRRLTVADAPAAASPSPNAVRASVAPSTGARAQTQPSPTSMPSPPPSPTDPILGLRQAIQQFVDTGDLKADTARDLNRAVDDLVKAIASAKPDDEANRLKALRDKLATLHREGKLTDAGYAALSSHVDQVAATLG